MPVDYCESLVLEGLTKEDAYQLLEESSLNKIAILKSNRQQLELIVIIR